MSKKFSELERAVSLNNGDLFALAQVDEEAQTGYKSVASPVSDVAQKILKNTSFPTDLDTDSKIVFGAINETADKLASKVGKTDRVSYNLFNGEFSATEGYTTGSQIVSATNYKLTKPIYLNVGSYYYNLITISYGGNAPYFSKTNQEGTTLSKMTATKTAYTLTVGDKTFDIYAFDISEAGYYIFNGNTGNTATASSKSFMITNQDDGVPTRYVPYLEVTQIESGVLLNDEMLEQVQSIIGANPLYQKNMAADGDSICYGIGYLGGYAKIIADAYEMGYQNLAIGGGTIAAETYTSGGTARHWICRTMQNLSASADYIIIEGGVNDAATSVPLGSMSSGYTATLDDTTFYGALETIFKTLTTKHVGKKYGFIIPHRMISGMYPNGNYNNAIVECGIKWGVPVLDLSKSVPPFNSFRNDATLDAIRQAYTNEGDGWHPSEICYRQYYVPQIEAWLRTL